MSSAIAYGKSVIIIQLGYSKMAFSHKNKNISKDSQNEKNPTENLTLNP